MSRRIIPASRTALSDEDRAMRDTESGKLLFTHCKGRNGAFLIQNDKLTAAVFPEQSRIGSVYVAKVRNVVKNIDACFVEIRAGEICFLSFRDAAYPLVLNRSGGGRLVEGDELPVQVIRDAQKTKQSTVSAHLSLSNDHFALAFGQRRAGFSTRLTEEQKRLLTKRLVEEAILTEDCLNQEFFGAFGETAKLLPPVGIVVRTRAAELLTQPEETLRQSFLNIAQEFGLLIRNAFHRTCFSCLRESDNLLSGVLDTATAPGEYGEIVTDEEEMYRRLRQYTAEHMPEKQVRLYRDPLLSLSNLYSLESRINAALGERVWLKSGGYLVIQPTEALTVIDVNSGKYEARHKAGDEAAFQVNREAAREIALQLRLRNLSGIILVDFINMETESCRRMLIDFLESLVKRDRVKTSVIDMTPLGLVEITRKKTTKPLREQLEIGSRKKAAGETLSGRHQDVGKA